MSCSQSGAEPTPCFHPDDANIGSSIQPPPFRSAVIAHLVEQTGIELGDIFSRKSERPIAHARQAIYAGLRERGWTFHQIGSAMNRDHSTVIYGARQHRLRQQEQSV